MRVKKTLAVFLATMMAMTSLAGCGGTGNSTTTGGETNGETENITLKVWAPQEDQVATEGHSNGYLATLCEQFDEAHPEWDITFEYGVMSEAEVADQATKDLEKAADVFLYSNDLIPKMVEAGALAKLGGSNVEEMKAHNSESMVGSVTYNDGVYGFPFTPNTYFLYYDKSKFTEEEVKNLDTMMAKDLGDKVDNFAFDLDNSWYLPAFFYAAGGELFGPNGDDETAGTTFGEHPEVTEYLIHLFNNKKFFVEDTGASIAKFKDGSLGSYISGSWDAAAIKEALGENFGVTKLPTININGQDSQLYSFAGSKAVGVNPTSKHMAASVALAAYLAGEEAQQMRFDVRNITPTWDTVANSEEVKADPVATAQILEIDEASKTQPLVKKMSDFWSPVEALGKSIVQGDTTLENAKDATTKMGEGIMK